MDVLSKIQHDSVAQTLVRETLLFVTSDPFLMSAWVTVQDSYKEQNWLKILTEVTRVLKEPSMKPVIYKQLKRLLNALKFNKEVVRSMFTSSIEETDPKTVEYLRAGVDFLFAIGNLVDEFKMKKIIHDISIEVGDCCKVFLESSEPTIKKTFGFFSPKSSKSNATS